MIPINDTGKGTTFSVKVQPRARRTAVVGVVGDAIKLAVTAPPVDGKANQAVIELFADLFEIPRASVTIASGEANRTKVLRIAGLNKEVVQDRLARILNSKISESTTETRRHRES